MGVSFPATTVVRTGVERATLIRRTYSLVFLGVLCTMAGTTFGLANEGIMLLVAAHPFLTFFVAMAPLFMAMREQHAFPANIAYTLLFTVMEGVWLSPLIFRYGQAQPGLVSEAAVLTASTFGVLTAYAFLSRRDFSAWGGFFAMGLWVLIGTSLLNLFFHNQAIQIWLASATVFIFGGLLVFDTWRIRNAFGPDDYVAAAVQIYLDLLNIFLAILSLLGGRRD